MPVTTPLQGLSSSEVPCSDFCLYQIQFHHPSGAGQCSGPGPTQQVLVYHIVAQGPASSLRWHYHPSKDGSHTHGNQEEVAQFSFTARRWLLGTILSLVKISVINHPPYIWPVSIKFIKWSVGSRHATCLTQGEWKIHTRSDTNSWIDLD